MTGSPSNKTIWLHIGTEKTGTSTIQTVCMWNRELLASAGLLYPEAPILAGTRTHAGLVYFAAEKRDITRIPKFGGVEMSDEEMETYRQTVKRKLKAEIKADGVRTILLSSEHLSSGLRKRPSVGKLIRVLRSVADEVKVIVYLRPQHQVYPSAYSTQVKGGSIQHPRPPESANNFFYNYDRMLTLWEAAVGRENMVVRLFERSGFVNGDLIDDFFGTLGVALPPGLKRPKVSRNQGLDADSIEFLRIANTVRPEGASALDWHDLIKRLEWAADRNAPVVAPEVLAQIDSLYKPSNDLVAERYFPDRPGGLFPPFAGTGSVTSPDLPVERAVAIALRLWVDTNKLLRAERAVNEERIERRRAREASAAE